MRASRTVIVPSVTLVLAIACSAAVGQGANRQGRADHATAAEITYEKHVRPIFQRHCVQCHKRDNLQDAEVSGRLALDSYEAVMRGVGGDKPHAVIVPQKGGASRLLAMLVERDETLRMPLEADPLPKEQIELIRQWIDQGAKQGTLSQPGDDIAQPRASARSRALRTLDILLPVAAQAPADLLPDVKERALCLALPIGPLAPVTALAYSPDGKLLAVGRHGRLSIWDAATGAAQRSFTSELAGAVHDVAFSPDGAVMAVVGGLAARQGQILLFDTGTWQVAGRLEGHRDVVFAAAFSPDGKKLASGSFDKTVKVWDRGTGQADYTIDAHSDFVYAVAFSPDGKLLASASKDRTVKLFDVATGESRRTLSGHEQDVLALAFAPDGKHIVSAGLEPALQWWSLEDGSMVRRVGGHGGPVHAIAASPDGKRLATASADKTLRLWDSGTGALQKNLTGSDEWLYSVAIRPDGRQIAGGGWDGLVRIWDIASGNVLVTLAEPPPHIASSPEFLAITPQGYYRASEGIGRLLGWRLGGQIVLDPDLGTALHKADMVERALADQPPEAAKVRR